MLLCGMQLSEAADVARGTAGASPCSADAVPDGDIVGVDIQVVRGCGAARQDELRHGQLAGSEHIICLCSTEPAQR